MEKERFKIRVAVFLILTRQNPESKDKKQILLQKRQNTGYMDNMYDACASGHLEDGESILEAMQREAKEEACMDIKRDDLNLALVYHASYKENLVEYIRFYFLMEKYEGKIEIGEPDKCSEMIWVNIDELPENTIPHLKTAINCYISEQNYCQDNF